jgi:protein TonB
MWILAGLFLFLAVASMAAGWVAGHGTLGGLFSTIHGTTPLSNGQQENVMLPSVRPPARISEIEIVDANNQRWVIPFGPPGTGIEENPRRQTPVNAPARSPNRPAVEPPASAPGLHPSPIGESILPEKTNPPVSPALLSNPQNVSPAPTKSHIEVPPPLPVPSTEVPQAGVLQPGEIVRRVDPIYPESAQAQRIEGTVKLRVTIGADGAVRSVTAISGPDALVEAARAAVRQWRYTPTLLDGKPVEAEEYVSIVFQLPPASR